jgi:hypothetical protein
MELTIKPEATSKFSQAKVFETLKRLRRKKKEEMANTNVNVSIE